MTKYPFMIQPLSDEEGGGFLIEYPDLPGCMADGATVDEALQEGRQAVCAWIETANALSRTIPKPTQPSLTNHYSGKYVQRLPKSLHAQLSSRARKEGMSINALAMSYIAKGVGFTEQASQN